MLNLNSIDISKWFKFPEILITIGVILLIISIVLIIIAFLTTDKKSEIIEDDSKDNVDNNDSLSKKKAYQIKDELSVKINENASEKGSEENKQNSTQEVSVADDEDEEIELL